MHDSYSQSPRPAMSNIPQPYPPPSADEVRLTRHLERIEHKLDTIFAMLQSRSVTVGLPEDQKAL